MKKIINGVIFSAIGLMSINASAVNISSDMKVSANLMAGCIFSAEDINFGVLDTADNSQRIVPANISIQCSKGTTLRLSTDSSSYTGTPIYLNGQVNTETGKNFKYLVTPFSGNVPNITISQGHMNHGITSGSEEAHTTLIKVNTSDKVNLVFNGIIEAGQITKSLIPGDYSTSLTYTITY